MENLMFVTCFAQASVTTTHQAWILGVETVGPEFARGWQGLAQDGVVGDFDPEKPVVRRRRAGVIKSTVASSVDRDTVGNPNCVDRCACPVAIKGGRGDPGPVGVQDGIVEAPDAQELSKPTGANVRVVVNPKMILSPRARATSRA